MLFWGGEEIQEDSVRNMQFDVFECFLDNLWSPDDYLGIIRRALTIANTAVHIFWCSLGYDLDT